MAKHTANNHGFSLKMGKFSGMASPSNENKLSDRRLERALPEVKLF
jgi:hypothetical protein